MKIYSTAELRGAFHDWLDAVPLGGWEKFDHEGFFAPMVDGKPRSLRWVAEKLVGSRDILPPEYCNVLGLLQGSTYGEAAYTVLTDWLGDD